MNPWATWWQWWTLTNALMGYSAYYPMWWCDFGKVLNHSQQEYDGDLWRRYMDEKAKEKL